MEQNFNCWIQKKDVEILKIKAGVITVIIKEKTEIF